jgi:hypothetical protein
MRDRLKRFPELRIFCQNVNRNYGYMDTLLASLYDEYDLLFIQEPPWRRIRSAPSSASRVGEDVIGPPISPNWGVIHRPSGLEEPPRVLVYFNVRIAALRPAFRRDLVDHRDVILFSLGLGAGQRIFANVYSDTQHTAVWILHEDLVALPRLHLMCGDFNIRHASWDPNGPEVCVHADRLMAVCDALGLTLSSPVEEGPTHFPYNEGLTPTVIDLIFFFFFFFIQQFITRCSIAVRGKPYKQKYSLRVYTCKIGRDITALTSPFRAVMSPARAKRRQENDKEYWALRRLPKPALAPDGCHPQHAQSTPKDVPSRSRTRV